MSTTAVNEFLQRVIEDQSLQAELVQAMQAPNDREVVTQLGNQNGFEFTSDELWAEVQKRQQDFESRQAAGELSDEELEAIAGGLSPAVVIAITGIVASAASTAHMGFSVSQATW